MPVNRKTVVTALTFFTDPKAMKARYGITITQEQISAAKKAIQSYQAMSDADLRRVDENAAKKWPYSLDEGQRYDKLMHGTELTMPQTMLWQNIKNYLKDRPKDRRDDPAAIAAALRDMEGFLQLNMYIGAFDENRKLIDGDDMATLMKLFNLSYAKYAGR